MAELTDLLTEIEETNYSWYKPFQFFFDEVQENPNAYSLREIGERKETREIGKDDIPKNGKIIAYVDNDFYELQTAEFKERFPELNTDKGAAVAEKVISLNRLDKDKVELTIKRYLIMKK